MPATNEPALLDAIADLGVPGTVTDARKHKTPRKHAANFPMDRVVIVPEENYRWGSEEAMKADLAKADLPLGNGEIGCSYDLLRDSIRAIGVEEPVGLVERADGHHVIYGFTRCLAARDVGLDTIPAYLYGSELPEAEMALLQLRENSQALKRSVNWVAETEQYQSISAHLLNRRLARMAEAGEVGRQETISAHKACNVAASRILGRHPSGMKSRVHFIHYLDKRVVEMSRQGYFSLQAAREFHSGNVDNLYPPAFVTAVLKLLHGADGYKSTILPADVRRAVNGVKAGLATGDIVLRDGSAAPPAPERKGHTMNRTVRNARAEAEKADSAEAEHGPLSKMKAPDKIRQSSAILRDISELLAMECLAAAGLTMGSDPAAVEKVVHSREWHRIEGIGFGAGDISMPPLFETVLGGRKTDDPEVQHMHLHYERTAQRYVVTAFVRAFLRMCMRNAGIRDLDFSDQGWLLGKTMVEGKNMPHRQAYNDAVAAGLEPADLPLLERAKIAWVALKPLVKRPTR